MPTKVTRSRRLRRILGEANRVAEGELRDATEDIAQRILGTQVSLVPVDQGNLRASLTYRVSKTGIQARIGLITRGRDQRRGGKGARLLATGEPFSDLFYAKMIEYGTKGFTGRVRARGGRKAYNVSIPPMAPRPFIQPSFDMHRDQYIRSARDAVDRAIKKVSRR